LVSLGVRKLLSAAVIIPPPERMVSIDNENAGTRFFMADRNTVAIMIT
jgi:hypothetical protein